jgi:deoxyribodipyrimidine photolyase-related protein
MATSCFIIFPHHLFEDVSALQGADIVYIVEEYLFFSQYSFHQQKIAFHRATMRYYEQYLKDKKINTQYISSQDKEADCRNLLPFLAKQKIKEVQYYEVSDFNLNKRIQEGLQQNKLQSKEFNSLLFINSQQDLNDYFGVKQKYFQTDFYTAQRKKLNILIDENGKPVGGKWSYDADNRSKYPKDKKPPTVVFPRDNEFDVEARQYSKQYFSKNLGEISNQKYYPSTHVEAKQWLQHFLQTRFEDFGVYEDAIVKQESILNHSVLTPMLNVGLITPQEILKEAIHYAKQHAIPLNSLEGFIRQIIGWREFIRGVYQYKGVEERTKNYWKFTRKIPASFYDGTTGIEPIDVVINKVLQTGYCHHIERLMILGNFMLLCEFDPNEVYRWFMELFIDAYDWVMVTNIYGMSQFADGGLMATKPYISGSAYLLKMSDYKKGEWCAIWDALFWHFMNKQRQFFLQNPRLGMLIGTYDKMKEERKTEIKHIAEHWFSSIRE